MDSVLKISSFAFVLIKIAEEGRSPKRRRERRLVDRAQEGLKAIISCLAFRVSDQTGRTVS